MPFYSSRLNTDLLLFAWVFPKHFCFIKIFPSHTVTELVDNISQEVLSYAVEGLLLTHPKGEMVSQPSFGNISGIRIHSSEKIMAEQVSQGRTMNSSSGDLMNVVISFPTTFPCHKTLSSHLWLRYSTTCKHPLILPASLWDTKRVKLRVKLQILSDAQK